MSYDVGLLLDGLILVFLSVTIFYAARLSLFLKSFREGKDGVQLLIRDLSITLDKAEQSVQTMKAHAQESEGELREIMNEAKFLSDELRFMNETGDSLANRLEKLADRNRELVDLMENAGGIGTQKITPFEPGNAHPGYAKQSQSKPAKRVPKKPQEDVAPDDDIFEISDFDIDDDDERDFMALEDGAYREEESAYKSKVNTEAKSKLRSFAIFDRDHMDGREIEDDLALMETANQEDLQTHNFHSQAEKDLYDALQRKKHAGKRVSEVT